ncbi:hypothetical protein ACQ33O_11450 [Ferruginibacter sp. SUN002]|uniref:hypothetical protein n=1 Tax=Ferruginibacter sp. SUN002 TaxID=2937789 RepID=UPI003D36D57C
MNTDRKLLLPLLLVFLILNGFFLAGKSILDKWHIDNYVLIVANCILLLTAIATFRMQRKALQDKNPNVFVRSVMGSVMIKMAVVIIAIMIYRFALPQQFSKMSVFAAMILYLIYLAVEVKVILKLNKSSNV